jgi:hypothetical protein
VQICSEVQVCVQTTVPLFALAMGVLIVRSRTKATEFVLFVVLWVSCLLDSHSEELEYNPDTGTRGHGDTRLHVSWDYTPKARASHRIQGTAWHGSYTSFVVMCTLCDYHALEMNACTAGHICQSVCRRLTTPGDGWEGLNEVNIMQGEVNITITILDITHRPVFNLKLNSTL